MVSLPLLTMFRRLMAMQDLWLAIDVNLDLGPLSIGETIVGA